MIKNLRPQDFKAAAKRGWYVYAYLRSKDHTPYYIGISSNAYRATNSQHTCAVPKAKSRIRLMRSSLTEQEAKDWEIAYIAHYGRKDLGSGILRNLTDGGEGCLGGPQMLASAEKYGFAFDEWRGFDQDTRSAICVRYAHGKRGEELLVHRNDLTAAQFGVTREELESWTPQWRSVISGRYFKGLRGAELLDPRNKAEVRLDESAASVGIDSLAWREFDKTTKQRIKARYSYGMRGEELLQDIDPRQNTEQVAAKYGKTLDEWNDMTPRQRVQAWENKKTQEDCAERWGVELRLIQAMTDDERRSYPKLVRAAGKRAVCPLLWFVFDPKERSRIAARFRTGWRGMQLLEGFA